VGHLDTCQYQTLVHGDIPRVKCQEHGALQVEVPWAERNARFTLLFEAFVIDWLKESSINAVSRRLAISWNAIDGIMRRAVERGLAARSNVDVQHLAVDEVCSKKGHEYVTVVSNGQAKSLTSWRIEARRAYWSSTIA
jgi:transposase